MAAITSPLSSFLLDVVPTRMLLCIGNALGVLAFALAAKAKNSGSSSSTFLYCTVLDLDSVLYHHLHAPGNGFQREKDLPMVS